MKAVVLRAPNDLAVLEVPAPEPPPGHVLVRVHACGICGSDVRYLHGENPWAKQTLGREVPNPPNIILGHELVGTVESVHDAADAHLVGRRVGVNTFVVCGRCVYCRSGRENLCPHTRHLGHGQGWSEREYYPGGMAELCPVDAGQVYPLPEHVTDEQATFLDPLIAALHAVDVGAPRVLATVAVYGAGPIGLLIAQLVKVYGAARTFINDLAEENLRVAREVGVDTAVNVAGGGGAFPERVRRETDGEGVDLVFNTVGTTESIEESLGLVRKGGTLVLLATKEDTLRFPALLLSGERAVRTASNAKYSDFPRALALLAGGRIRVDPLITHRFPLSRAVEAFGVAAHKAERDAIKVVLDCRA